jgi:hypothetical protein
MYADRDHVRYRRVNLSLNEQEDAAAEAIARLNGMQKSAYLRELILEGLMRRRHAANSADERLALRAAQS